MKSRLILGLVLLAALVGVPTFAQKTENDKKKQKPNYSGTWVYDESKSNKTLKALFKSSKKIEDSKKKTTDKIVIGHLSDVLTITETLLVETFDEFGKLLTKSEQGFPSKTYYTDKRGERNLDEKNQPIDSITKWNDKQILVVIKDKKNDQTSSMAFSLSKDGQELTIKYLSFKSDKGVVSPTGFGDRVFNKTN